MPTAIQQEASSNSATMRIIASLVSALGHLLLWLMGIYSNKLFISLEMLIFAYMTISLIKLKYFNLGEILRAICLGTSCVVMAFIFPEFFVYSFILHMITIHYALTDVEWNYQHYFLGSGIFAWIAYYLFWRVPYSINKEGFQFLNADLEANSLLYQAIFGCGVNYMVAGLSAANRYLEIKTMQKYEKELVQVNSELEETNKNLQISNKEIKEALQEKENFILRFSHEIRNPLNSLLGNVELCYEQTADEEFKQMLKDAKVSGEILLQLLNNVLDTAKVAAGRLEVSLISQPIRPFLERAWIICSEIIRKKRLYGCLSLNLKVPEVLEFDNHRIMQILINLISNAAKFTDKGYVKVFVDFVEDVRIRDEDMLPRQGLSEGGELLYTEVADQDEDTSEMPKRFFENLTLKAKSFLQSHRNSHPILETHQDSFKIPHLNKKFFPISEPGDNTILKSEEISPSKQMRNPTIVQEETKEGYIRIEIVDSGCGMQKRDVDKVFKKFQQVSPNSSQRQIGTGLGLWITRELIEMMNGKVEIYSKPNKGTAMVIMVKSKSTPKSSIEPYKVNDPLNSLFHKELTIPKSKEISRVLVVEDMEYNQEVNRRLLEKCNVQHITIANNGQEAVNIFLKKGSQYFDLILMDIDMPVMDGKTAVKIIRQEEKNRRWIPVNIVFLTGFAESKTQKELLNTNGDYRANGFYSKPASLETFRSFILESKFSNATSAGLIALKCSKINSQDIPLSHLLVLVVDDDSFNLIMVSKMLKLCGVNTLEARNGLEAVELYEANWKIISCILMDCEMPVLNGLEATRRILTKHSQRAALTGKKMRIYGLTGHVGGEFRQKCLEAGMEEVLEKPIKFERLNTLFKNKISS